MPYVRECNAKFGDYQFDLSNPIARHVAQADVTPESVAQAILENLPDIPLIGKVGANKSLRPYSVPLFSLCV